MVRAHEYIAHYLEQRGVSTVFEVVGGMITFILDSLHTKTRVRVVSVHHEQAAAFAADAFGRITGIPGVALATSGPGATNLLTGVGSCYFDSSPAVFLTGQVNRHELRGARAIRQGGFQETDIVSIARPITKAAWMAERVEQIPELLDRAFALAVADRPGPVLIDIPMDLQSAELEAPAPASPRGWPGLRAESQALLDELWIAISRAERPLVLAGGGVRAAGLAELLQRFVELTGIPVITSLMGVDVLPSEHPLRVGMIGTYGNRWANLALGRSDLLLVLGSRLDIRQTGADTEFFARGRTIFHVDSELAQINHRVTGCHAIHEHLHPFLAEAGECARACLDHRRAWSAELDELRRAWPDTGELADLEGINPNAFMHRLAHASRQAAAYAVDVGQHQMWAAQSIDLEPGQRFLTSGGMGSMGFALPAAIGACFAFGGKRPVVVVAGDGGFQCNLQELQTVARNRLPLKIVLLDNACHGMVRQFQQSYFDERYHSTVWGYSAPDFRKVAEAYGIAARSVESEGEINEGLAALWRDPEAPALLRVKIPMAANAYPKIAFGHPLTEMEPFFKPLEIEGT